MKNKIDTLYLVSPLAQKKETEKYCFDECGKIIVGGVTLFGAPFLPCRHKDCPYLEKEKELGKAEIIEGKKENIIVRKLKIANLKLV